MRRNSLLEAAVVVIAKQGLTGVTIRNIAEQAKCSYGVVAFHFKSKDGVILAALDHMLAEYEAHFDKLKAAAPGPAQVLTAMLHSDFDSQVSSVKRMSVWISFWAEAARVKSYRTRCAEQKLRYNAIAAEAIAELAAQRDMVVDAERIARSLNAMIDGFWISSTVTSMPRKEHAEQAKQDCFAYLRTAFPDDF